LLHQLLCFCLEFYRHAFKLRDFRPERKCSTWARRQPLPTGLGPKINTDPQGGHRDASQMAVSGQLPLTPHIDKDRV
jgi:hypothetical protein